MEGMLSPADVAVLSGNTGNRNNDGMFGDNGAWWIVLFLIFGWGRNGFGNGGFGGNGGNDSFYNAFGVPNVYSKLDGISNGICDSTFALNNTMTNGFAGVNQGITTNGYETRGAITDLGYRLQDCCCDIKSRIADCLI